MLSSSINVINCSVTGLTLCLFLYPRQALSVNVYCPVNHRSRYQCEAIVTRHSYVAFATGYDFRLDYRIAINSIRLYIMCILEVIDLDLVVIFA